MNESGYKFARRIYWIAHDEREEKFKLVSLDYSNGNWETFQLMNTN